MESSFYTEPTESRRIRENYSEKPVMRDLFQDFCRRMDNMSLTQKIDLAYTYLANKRPDPILSTTRKLDRVLYEIEFGKKIRDSKKAEKKQFKFPFKWNGLMRKSKKENENILVFYFTIKGDIVPMLIPLWGGNMIIIKGKPYEVDPRAFWRIKKYRCMCFKEIDRRPISNLDYDEIKRRGDSTQSDEFLIKAAMRALAVQPKKAINKGAMIVIGVAVLAAVVYFLSQK